MSIKSYIIVLLQSHYVPLCVQGTVHTTIVADDDDDTHKDFFVYERIGTVLSYDVNRGPVVGNLRSSERNNSQWLTYEAVSQGLLVIFIC